MRGQYPNSHSIRELRRQQGLTQEDLAAMASCDVKTVRRAERGERLDLESLHRIAQALDVSFSVVIASDSAPSAEREPNEGRSSAAIIRDWLHAIEQAEPDAWLSLYAPDAELHWPGPDRFRFAGRFRGTNALRVHFGHLTSAFRFSSPDWSGIRVAHAGEHLLVRATHPISRPSAGHTVAVDAMHEFRIHQGRIAEHLALVDCRALDDAKKRPRRPPGKSSR